MTVFFVLVAQWVMPPLYPHYHPLLVGLSQVLFPIVALLGVSGIVVGILNTYDEFSVPALTPVAWNLVIIAGLVFGVPHVHGESNKLYVYAASILAGTVVQVLLPIPWLRGRDGRLQAVIDWRDPAVKQVFRLMLPVTLGLGLININALIDGVIGGWLIDSRRSRRRSTQPSGSTCCRRECSRSPSRRCCSRRSRDSPPAATTKASAGRRHWGCARSRSCSCRPASSRRCSPSR